MIETINQRNKNLNVLVPENFQKLKFAKKDELGIMGFTKWKKELKKYELWLFPAVLYDFIPHNLKITNKKLQTFEFDKRIDKKKQEYGVLDFGILRLKLKADE